MKKRRGWKENEREEEKGKERKKKWRGKEKVNQECVQE